MATARVKSITLGALLSARALLTNWKQTGRSVSCSSPPSLVPLLGRDMGSQLAKEKYVYRVLPPQCYKTESKRVDSELRNNSLITSTTYNVRMVSRRLLSMNMYNNHIIQSFGEGPKMF